MKSTHPAAKKGKRNLIGPAVRRLRMARRPPMSQKDLEDKLRLFYSIELDRSAIARIEHGLRYVLDYELTAIARALGKNVGELLPRKMPPGFESLNPR